ncbi:MAG TPA: CPBP family intramembrane glutamic endopeptidase [Gemmatimonadales bacterium]|jgi:hypothetical protein|nr:CPBP family intramembrane glutamic endopeptidase [Gemmatimonadales bacterium]
MNYWQLSRSPRYSVLFAVPLLVAYETLAWALGGGATEGVRNGADVLLKSVFLGLGGQRGLVAFDVALLALGLVLVWRDRGPLQPRIFLLMGAEAAALALLFGGVAGMITTLLLRGPAALAVGGLGGLGLSTQIMLSLGAGIYEELLFRVLLVGALSVIALRVLRWRPVTAKGMAVVVGALVFSAFHYIGPYGDRWSVESFTYRAVAGLLFSALFVVRGFGVTAWTHALYDVFLAVMGVG